MKKLNDLLNVVRKAYLYHQYENIKAISNPRISKELENIVMDPDKTS